MMSIGELLQRCQQTPTDDTAWSEFWRILENAARDRVQKILRGHGLDPEPAAEVFQELFLDLRKKSWGPLAAFQGTTEAKLSGYLRSLTCNFAKDWVRKER